MDRCFTSDLKTCSIFFSIVIVSISYIFTAISEMKIFLKVTFISPRINKVNRNKLKPCPAKLGRQTVPYQRGAASRHVKSGTRSLDMKDETNSPTAVASNA